MPGRLFKKLKSKDTVFTRVVNTRLQVPRSTTTKGWHHPSPVCWDFWYSLPTPANVHPLRKTGWNQQMGPPNRRRRTGKLGNSCKSTPR